MENVFFEFVETYWEDIAGFLKAFVDFIMSIVNGTKGE